MQDLLTSTAEIIVIVPLLFLAIDFLAGLLNLYTSDQHKLQGAIAFVPTQGGPKETAPLNDPRVGEGEIEVINQCCCLTEASPVISLLPPAMPEVVEQPPIDYSGWSIRALKKQAQNLKLSKYSSLTKKQLISRLTAA